MNNECNKTNKKKKAFENKCIISLMVEKDNE